MSGAAPFGYEIWLIIRYVDPFGFVKHAFAPLDLSLYPDVHHCRLQTPCLLQFALQEPDNSLSMRGQHLVFGFEFDFAITF